MVRLCVAVLLCLGSVSSIWGHEPEKLKDTQAETIKFTTPAEALARITVPEGFRVSLFAAEPEVRQPIGVATDARGRLWVAENYTYAELGANFDLTQRDRVIILEDSDHDGKADQRKVFWDKGQKLTSVEPGFGGVWVLCPPRLLFIPDRNGDDIPDGEPEVVLDGFEGDGIRHNIPNGLRWGPDGWLYGRHGILATSHLGAPGTNPAERVSLNCGLWRYHPTKKVVEVVCRGTTNPWGADWSATGELFFINTVINHLFHVVPGAYYERMFGEHDNPYLYELMGHSADHYHWDTAEKWSDIRKTGVTATTDQAGGGHAHSGLMFYLGNTWPEKYRGTLFTVNFHGRRLNNDAIERAGTGFVGKHRPDHLKTTDPWFRGIDLIAANDGGVYLADWSDIGECHDNDGIHRSSGRIFKIDYGTPAKPSVADVSQLSEVELVKLLTHANEWYARQARKTLQERAAAGKSMGDVQSALKQLFETDPNVVHKLRAMWSLAATNGVSTEWLLQQSLHAEESVRVWAVRLLSDQGISAGPVVMRLAEMAEKDPSGLVLTYVASALQRMPLAERWDVAGCLARRAEFAKDSKLPLMVWYGIEPGVPEETARAVELAQMSAMPFVVRAITRRLTESIQQVPGPVDRLVTLAGESKDAFRAKEILIGMTEGLRGWRTAPEPKSWKRVQMVLGQSGDDEIRQRVRDLSVVFGDGRSLKEVLVIASEGKTDLAGRRDAIRVLVEAHSKDVLPLLKNMISDRDLGADAARGIGAFDDLELGKFLATQLPTMRDTSRVPSVISLCARPAWAKLLLVEIEAGKVDRGLVPAFQVRQMSSYSDPEIQKQVAKLWPDLKTVDTAKKERIAKWKTMLTSKSETPVNLSAGRGLFNKSCASCHILFGQGGKIGPDLTGSQRSNLDYLLENIGDPSAQVAADYRMATIAMKDGRVLNGVVTDRPGPTIIVQTPTERLFLNRMDIDEMKKTELSLMPEGLLDTLKEQEVRDLMGYLMSPVQVAAPQ